MKEELYYIYCHTFPNGKMYFGACNRQPEERWRADGKGYKDSLVGKAIQKYGWDNIKHEILFKTTSLDEVIFLENFLIAKFNTTDRLFGYNVSPGNYGTSWNLGLTKYTSSALKLAGEHESVAKKEKFANGELVAWNKGLTKETNDSIANAAKALSISKTGSKWSDERRAAQPDMRGKNNPNYGHKWSDEQKKAQSDKLRGKRPYNARCVICIETTTIYSTLSEAESKTHINRKLIAKCCKGELEAAGGYKWEYYNYVE